MRDLGVKTSRRQMQDREYQEVVDGLFYEIEDAIDTLDAEIDVDASGGLLTIGFPDGSSLILSRQAASQEIWVAAKSGGYHLSFQDGRWLCHQSGESLRELLDRLFTEQLGETVSCFQSSASP